LLLYLHVYTAVAWINCFNKCEWHYTINTAGNTDVQNTMHGAGRAVFEVNHAAANIPDPLPLLYTLFLPSLTVVIII